MIFDILEATGTALDAVGVLVIIIGFAIATLRYLMAVFRSERDTYRGYRHDIGKAILLGLEVLVAADIIRTVAVQPTLDSVAVLALIVAIRTFLSMSLEIELEGRLPWRRPKNGSRSEDR